MEPDFEPLDWKHQDWLNALFRAQPPSLSAYTFTNLFTWRRHYRFEVARGENLALLRVPRAGGFDFFSPWGPGDVRGAVKKILAQGSRVLRVPEDVKVRLENDGELKFVFDRDNSDYVYRTADLSELAGRHYDGKRNLIRKFRAAHPGYVYTPLDPGNAPACLTVEDAWCVEKDCDHEAGLDQERLAIRDMLEHFGDFPLRGGSIWVDGQCAAVALGEALNPETLVVHILKAAPGMPGLYQVILNEFVKRAGAGLTAVNLEQDLGLDGLRRAKESYRPSGLARAFTLAP